MRYSLKRQLGFIYLTTGANGTGKTLFTLEDVRKRQVEENRPVFYNGFDMVPEVEKEFGWQKFDPLEWQNLPQGSLIIMDEVHNQMPKRNASSPVPPYVKALGEHRKHGFDFYMLTQHPSNLDPFLVKIIGAPGHHRHIKRPGGAQLASVLTWNSVNMNCEKPSSGNSGEVQMRAYPKKVYSWYTSAVMHTSKRRIPKQVFVLAFCLLAIPALGYFAVQQLPGMGSDDLSSTISQSSPSEDRPLSAPVAGPGSTPESYLASFAPRVPGLPHTAPRYDEVTKPVRAPYPAACAVFRGDCKCYTQQGTKMPVPPEICVQIVDGGFFVEWQHEPPAQAPVPGQSGQSISPALEGSAPGFPSPPSLAPRPASDVTASLPLDRPSPTASADADVLAFMQARKQ